MAPWGPSVFGTQDLPLLLLWLWDGAWAVLSSVPKAFPLWKPQLSHLSAAGDAAYQQSGFPWRAKRRSPVNPLLYDWSWFCPARGGW